MEKYSTGKKVKLNNGVAKITSVNPDGTATLNWVTPPKNDINGVNQSKGGFAGTLPAIHTNNKTLTQTQVETPTSTNGNTYESYASHSEKETETYMIDRQYELYNTEGFTNELNVEQSRIRMHNMLITDHTFKQDPSDIPGGCETCWSTINITENL